MNLITAGFRPLPSSPSLKMPSVAISLSISLIAPLYFGMVTLIHAIASDLVIQDDARLHIVWLQQWIDPELFPGDAIAHYYRSIQAIGFQWVYRIAVAIGIEPLSLAKILPLILALIATVYLFWVALWILPIPINGILITLIFNQNIWLKDDLASATPRAFIYPLFAAFLYYLFQDRIVLYIFILILQGLFYPQIMLVSLGILTLRMFHTQIKLNQVTIAWLISLGITGIILLFFSHQVAAKVGPLLTVDDMQAMSEFYLNGRREYYGISPIDFIFSGASGLRFPLFPPIIVIGGLLPWMMRGISLPLVEKVTLQVKILGETLLASLGLFFLAHLLFPMLYLPSRYTFYSTRFVMAIASGLTLTLILERAWHWLINHELSWDLRDRIKVIMGWGLAIAIIITPAIPAIFLPCQSWIRVTSPNLYERLAEFPKDTLIATLVPEANNIPAFSRRSVLVAEEFAIPYHAEFYNRMLERMKDLINAEYSPDLALLQSVIQTYGIDLWIVHQNFANPDYLSRQKWLVHSSISSVVDIAIAQLQQGIKPALSSVASSCSIFSENPLMILDTSCLIQINPIGES